MNWLKEIAQARDLNAVLEVVNEFIGAMPLYARQSLAMPAAVADAKQVFALHRRLADAASETGGDDGLQEIAVFFVRAAARLMELNGNGNGNGRHESTNQGAFAVREGNGERGKR
jgi:hypothetical protein